MRLKLIACKALFREVSLIAATSEHFIDATFIRQGFHDTPDILRETLQVEIDRVDSGDDIYTYQAKYSAQEEFDAILLGYGLCSNGIVGLHSKKHKMVVPRAHDCVTLFLGSKEKYKEYFDENGGTFWYNASWIENGRVPSEEMYQELRDYYAEKFGEENVEFLMENELTLNYTRATYIKWDELDFPQYVEYTKNAARYLGWEFDLIEGDSGLMRDFLNGKWDDRFLVVPPGGRIEPEWDDPGKIIKCEE